MVLDFFAGRDLTFVEEDLVVVWSVSFDEGFADGDNDVWKEVSIDDEDEASSIITPSQICVEFMLIGSTMKQPSAIRSQVSTSPSPALYGRHHSLGP